MVGSINKVILVGNLGADPKVANTASGTKVVNLNIATSDSWKDKLSGERKERTEWHRVVIFNPQLADVAEKYLRKGSKVYLEGQLQTRKWEDNNGQERYTTEIVLQNFSGNMVLLDGRGDGVPAGGNDVFSGSASNAGWDSSPAAAPAAYGMPARRPRRRQTEFHLFQLFRRDAASFAKNFGAEFIFVTIAKNLKSDHPFGCALRILGF